MFIKVRLKLFLISNDENSKMSKIKKKSNINRINKDTAQRLRVLSQVPYESLNQWIPAGSGNYERFSHDGRYRETCNHLRYELKCKNDPQCTKIIHSRCNKLDCCTCFVSTCSIKARMLNNLAFIFNNRKKFIFDCIY